MSRRAKSSAASERHFSRRVPWLIWLWLAVVLGSLPLPAQDAIVLVGSGSTVPAPLYSRWALEYDKRDPKTQMRYVPSGTNEGIRQISRGVGDFAAGEALLTDKQRKQGGLTALPAVLIGIVPVYNLPDLHQELQLSGEVLAEIFLGDVKTWNAPQVAKLNPAITLPNLAIRVVNRPAGKGSNYVFTDFLSKVSPKFRARIGVTVSPKWPVGISAERSSDMAQQVKIIVGSIGYVEYQYAVKGGLRQAAVLNSNGRFLTASPASMVAACSAVERPRWDGFSVSLTNAPGADSFPITSFTWIYLRTTSIDKARAAAFGDLLDWVYRDGQLLAVEEGYAALPPPLLAAVRRKVKALL
ncbi:MAG: phosphate ABC transporter substrate-binding protein PstS [Terriglobales bacterium]|jgi:phosphate transport system substrate-binding protein